jgi:hypothetical protein
MALTFTVCLLGGIGLYTDARVDPVCYDPGFNEPNSVTQYDNAKNDTMFEYQLNFRIRTSLQDCWEGGDVRNDLFEWGHIDTFRKVRTSVN